MAKFRHFGNILNGFGNLLMVYLVFGKLLFCFGIFLILLDKFAGL